MEEEAKLLQQRSKSLRKRSREKRRKRKKNCTQLAFALLLLHVSSLPREELKARIFCENAAAMHILCNCWQNLTQILKLRRGKSRRERSRGERQSRDQIEGLCNKSSSAVVI